MENFLLFLAVMLILVMLFAIGAGIILGTIYLQCRLQKLPLAPWTRSVRLGWHFFAFSIVTLLAFYRLEASIFCGIGVLLSCVLWLMAFGGYIRTPQQYGGN
jgi:hypothetical protein